MIARNSCARGVTAIGQSQLSLSNIVIENTAHPGIIVAHESAYATRVPNDVTVSAVRMTNAGGWNCSQTRLYANSNNCRT